MTTFENNLSTHVIRAVLLREFRAAIINRYFQIFAGASMISGLSATFFAENANAIAFFLVEIALFLVSLFAVLAGVSSAQAEREEWQLMFAQPVPRATYAAGKFIAYLSIFGAVLLLLFFPALLAGAAALSLSILYLQTLLLASVFLALGLAAGFFAHDRANALILGISAWLLLLFGIDLVGLFLARFQFVENVPDVWLALLMLNPLDAFRIYALFALEKIPAEAANTVPLANWWIANAAVWFGVLALLWIFVLITLASLRLMHWEE